MLKLLTNEFEDKYEMVEYINERPIAKDQIVTISENTEKQMFTLFWYEDEEITESIQRRMERLENKLMKK